MSYRAGFPIHTGYRLAAIEVHADIPGEFAGRIRRYDLAYQEDPHSQLALLTSVTMTGYDANGNGEPARSHAALLGARRFAEFGGEPPGSASHRPVGGGYRTGGPDRQWHAGHPQHPARQSHVLAQQPMEASQLRAGGGTRFRGGGRHGWVAEPHAHPGGHALGRRARAPGGGFLSQVSVLDSPSYHATHGDILARNLSWGAGTTFSIHPPSTFRTDGRAWSI